MFGLTTGSAFRSEGITLSEVSSLVPRDPGVLCTRQS